MSLRLTQEFINSLLPSSEKRADANETLAFNRQLEDIELKLLRSSYAENVGRSVLPTKTVALTAELSTYRQIDSFGKAKLISTYADSDFPTVTSQGKEYSRKVVGYGDAFEYNIMDLRRAAAGIIDLEAEGALAARMAIEQKIDALICTGDTDAGMVGIANHPDILDGGTAAAAWDDNATTPKSIIDDILSKLLRPAQLATKMRVAKQWDLYLPTEAYIVVNSKPVESSSGFYNGEMLASSILRSVPGLRSIKHWERLDTADGGTAERALLVPVSTEAGRLIMTPGGFEMLSPERRGAKFVVQCMERTGGAELIHPKAFAFLDGLTT